MLKDIEKSIVKTYRKTIWKKFVEAINKYQMIKENDKIAVCISGGKDSFLMAKCFQEIQRHNKFNFSLEYIVMDPGYTDEVIKQIVDNSKILGIPIKIFKSDIFKISETLDKNHPCYMCARMRRGFLYDHAKQLGCNKIALGHHFDDVIETVMLNIIYGGVFKTMMPRIKSTNFENMELIRPLYIVKEEYIIKWANYNKLRFINCACRMTEKLSDSSKRKEIKELINNYRKIYENVDINIFRSTEKVNLATILSYEDDNEVIDFLERFKNNL